MSTQHDSTERIQKQAQRPGAGRGGVTCDPGLCYPLDASKTPQSASQSAPAGRAKIGASLGNHTNKVSQGQNQAEISLSAGDYLPAQMSPIAVRIALLSEVRRLLIQDYDRKRAAGRVDELRGGQYFERPAGCHRWPLPDSEGVDLLHYPESMAGGVRGVMRCASVWACPPCSSKITERRRVELIAALADSGYFLSLLTLTLQHHAGEACADVWDRMSRAGKLLTKGSRWVGDKRRGTPGLAAEFGIVGYTRAVEPTVGDHGWHVHQHVLLAHDRPVDAERLQAAIRREWTGIVGRLGGYAAWDFGAVVTVGAPEEVISDYVAKTGLEAVDLRQDAEGWTVYHEIAKAPSKRGRQGGRTPLQLVADSLCGDTQAGELWTEYYWVSKGKRQMTHAGVMRDLLGANADKSDEEIEAEENEAAITLATLTHDQWQIVIGNDAMADVIEICATGDRRALLALLLEIGVFSHQAAPVPGDAARNQE